MNVAGSSKETERVGDGWNLAAPNRTNEVRQGKLGHERSEENVPERNVMRDIDLVNQGPRRLFCRALPELVVH